jgi:hypothetical protein
MENSNSGLDARLLAAQEADRKRQEEMGYLTNKKVFGMIKRYY